MSNELTNQGLTNHNQLLELRNKRVKELQDYIAKVKTVELPTVDNLKCHEWLLLQKELCDLILKGSGAYRLDKVIRVDYNRAKTLFISSLEKIIDSLESATISDNIEYEDDDDISFACWVLEEAIWDCVDEESVEFEQKA